MLFVWYGNVEFLTNFNDFQYINTNNVSKKNTIFIHDRQTHIKNFFFISLKGIYIYKRYVYMKATDDELFRGYSTTWRPKLIFVFIIV